MNTMIDCSTREERESKLFKFMKAYFPPPPPPLPQKEREHRK